MEHRPEAPLGRVLTAMVTPFDAEDNVDYAALWKLVRHLKNQGSDGVVVASTTGEGLALSRPEKVALFRAAVDATRGSMTVIAAVTADSTAESVALVRAARDCEVDAVLVSAPPTGAPERGIVEHLRAVADAASVPVLIAYGSPTGPRLDDDALRGLAEHPQVMGGVDHGDDVHESVRTIRALPEGFCVYAGNDHRIKDLVAAGAVGAVTQVSHLAGPEVAAMIDATIDDDWESANRLNDLLAPLSESLHFEPDPMPLKASLTEFWDGVGRPRLPYVPAEQLTVEAVGRALEPVLTSRSR